MLENWQNGNQSNRTLSEWIKAVRSCIQKRIHKLKGCMNTKGSNIFDDPEVKNALNTLHDKYVVVPADKASNNIVSSVENTT